MSASSLPAISAAAPSADPTPVGPAGAGLRGSSTPGSDDAQHFDAHLHDARQQQSQATGGSRQDADASAPPAPAADTSKTADGKPAHHHKAGERDQRGADDGSQADTDSNLAATVLGLIGQSATPAQPAAGGGAEAGDDDPLAAASAPTSAALAAAMQQPAALQAAIQPRVLAGTSPAATAVGQAGTNGKPATGIVNLDAKLTDKDATDGTAKDGGQPAQGNADAAADAAAQAAAAATTASGAAVTAAGAGDAVAAPAAKPHALDAAVPAAGLLAATPVQQPATAVHVLDIGAPAGTPGFAQELGEQIAWLGGQEVKQANIRLHPAELGQLDVKVSLSHGRVDVAFTAQHPAAVTAVQQTLGQLDLMLAGQGLSLGQAQVGQQGGDGAPRGQSPGSGEPAGDGETVLGTTPIRQQQPVGLLDAFA